MRLQCPLSQKGRPRDDRFASQRTDFIDLLFMIRISTPLSFSRFLILQTNINGGGLLQDGLHMWPIQERANPRAAGYDLTPCLRIIRPTWNEGRSRCECQNRYRGAGRRKKRYTDPARCELGARPL